mgnify:CR=1 FL=1
MSDVQAGSRCKLTRAITHGDRVHLRGTEVTVRRIQDNEGRALVMATLDSSERLALFMTDLERIDSQEA